MTVLANTNEAVLIEIIASDGNTALFPQAKIFSSNGSLSTTISLSAIDSVNAPGAYSANWTPTIQDYYTVVITFYLDSGFTQLAAYDKVAELYDVFDTKRNILRILGINFENTVMDQTVYDGNNNLTSARIRCYNSATNADLAGATGLIFQYSVTATYSGIQLLTYKIDRVL